MAAAADPPNPWRAFVQGPHDTLVTATDLYVQLAPEDVLFLREPHLILSTKSPANIQWLRGLRQQMAERAEVDEVEDVNWPVRRGRRRCDRPDEFWPDTLAVKVTPKTRIFIERDRQLLVGSTIDLHGGAVATFMVRPHGYKTNTTNRVGFGLRAYEIIVRPPPALEFEPGLPLQLDDHKATVPLAARHKLPPSLPDKVYVVAEECVVCLDGPIAQRAIPCGHVCCCNKCAAGLEDCPICRAKGVVFLEYKA